MIQCDAVGKGVRLNKLFDPKSGKAVVVAVDHGIGGLRPGLEDLGAKLEMILKGEPDGVLMTVGAFKRYHRLFSYKGAPTVVVAVDTIMGSTLPGRKQMGEEHRLLSSVEDALSLGADGVKILLVFGRQELGVHANNMEMVAHVLSASVRYGMPVMVEPTLWGSLVKPEEAGDAQLIWNISRIAAELGADVLKVPPAEDSTLFSEMVSSLPVPVLILGGAKRGGVQEILEVTERAVHAGGAGVVFGRNVWEAEHPTAMVRALRAVVHEGVAADQAAKAAT